MRSGVSVQGETLDQSNISVMVGGMTSTRWLAPTEMRAWIAFVDCSTLLGDCLDQQLRRDARLTHAGMSDRKRTATAPRSGGHS